MWKSKNVNLGIIKQGTTNLVEFVYEGEESLSEVTTSCGCSVAEQKGKVITVKFIPSPVPHHLKDTDSYTTTKYVNLKEGKKHIQLSFTATVKSQL